MGNSAVDLLAKQQAATIGGEAVDLDVRDKSRRLRLVAKAHAHFAVARRHGQAHWPDVTYDERVGKRKLRSKPPPTHPHVLNAGPGCWKCVRCGRLATSVAGRERLLRTLCRSTSAVAHLDTASAAGSFGVAVNPHTREPIEPLTMHMHRLYIAGTVIFCSQCGRYAESKFRQLATECLAVAPTFVLTVQHKWRLNRLWRGVHPYENRALGQPQPLTQRVWAELRASEPPPAPTHQGAEAGRRRSYAEFANGDAIAKVVIPGNATVNGVPIRRLTQPTRDPYWTGFEEEAPLRAALIPDSSDESEGSSEAQPLGE